MRGEIDERRILIESGELAPHDGEWEIAFHEMSEMGNFALHDANGWFGLPMAQGLQLESGDVILQVGNKEVNSPAEFMRALRDFQPGDELEMDIKRQRKDRTLKTVMPENRTSLFAPEDSRIHTIKIITESK